MILAVSASKLDSLTRNGFICLAIASAIFSFYKYYMRVFTLQRAYTTGRDPYYDLTAPIVLTSAVTLLYGIIFLSNYSSSQYTYLVVAF
jgi:uncharacterized protein with PQ loop repeat